MASTALPNAKTSELSVVHNNPLGISRPVKSGEYDGSQKIEIKDGDMSAPTARELNNLIASPSGCLRCVFVLLRFLTIPSTPVPHVTERSTCCSPVSRINKNHKKASLADDARVIAGRFLISIFVLDYGAVAVGKIMHLDALDMSNGLGLQFVLVDIGMTTIEALAELFGTSVTPVVYKLMYPKHKIESRRLASFAVKVYAVSNLLAFLIYPVISSIAWIGCNLNFAVLISLILFRTIQYSVINQIGDAAVQMAKPHWLRTLEGTSMQIPGFNLGGCYIRTGTTEDTLSAHIALIALVFLPMPTALYFFIKDYPVGRLVMATLVALAVAVASMTFWCNERALTAGIKCETVDGNLESSVPNAGNPYPSGDDVGDTGAMHSSAGGTSESELVRKKQDAGSVQRRSTCCRFEDNGILFLSSLESFEQAILVLYVLVKVVNEQLTNSITAVVLVSLGSLFRNSFIVGSSSIGLMYLFFKICTENRRLSKNQGTPIKGKGKLHSYSFGRRLKRWLSVLVLILVFVSVSALLLLLRPSPTRFGQNSNTTAMNNTIDSICGKSIDSNVSEYEEDLGSTRSIMTIVAVAMTLPLYPAIKMFDVEYDSFMMDYERTRPIVVTSMQLWSSILSPLVHIIMFCINFFILNQQTDIFGGTSTSSISQTESGTIQVASVMVVSVSVQFILTIYFGVLDRLMPRSCSVYKSLARLDKARETTHSSGGTQIDRRPTVFSSERVTF